VQLNTHFSAIPDHRRPQGRMYDLGHLLLFSVLALPFTHNPQYHNKRSSIVYQGVADTHVLHGGIALPE